MKIRNGFVSNSSSSSFIIGIGIVKNLEKLKTSLDEIGIKYKDDSVWYEVSFVRSNDLKDKINCLGLNYINSSFNDTEVYLKKDKVKVDDTLVLVCICNNEGDEAFYRSEDDYECDYDIDLSYFSVNQQKLIDILNNKELVKDVDINYGAGRNG